MLHLDPGEHVILEVRKHWFIFFAYGAFLVIVAILPPIFYETIIRLLKIDIGVTGNFPALVFFLYMMWLLVLWMAFFAKWTNYYLDVWYITEKRIIDVNQKTLFHREISSLRFDKIQDITVEVRGLLATFLNFGDIHVQTAAENSGDFLLNKAANPERIRKLIFTQHNLESEKSRPVNIVHHDHGEEKPH